MQNKIVTEGISLPTITTPDTDTSVASQGTVIVDAENFDIRFHDGYTPGGVSILSASVQTVPSTDQTILSAFTLADGSPIFTPPTSVAPTSNSHNPINYLKAAYQLLADHDAKLSVNTVDDAAALRRENNLSDLVNATIARTNLGLGTAATHASTDFDAAGSAAAVSTTLTAAISSAVAGLGTASSHSATDFDTAGAAATAQANAQTFASGLVSTETTRATTAEGLALHKSANFSDLTNLNTALANLGLATSLNIYVPAQYATPGAALNALQANPPKLLPGSPINVYVMGNNTGAAYDDTGLTNPVWDFVGCENVSILPDPSTPAIVQSSGKGLGDTSSTLASFMWPSRSGNSSLYTLVIPAPTGIAPGHVGSLISFNNSSYGIVYAAFQVISVSGGNATISIPYGYGNTWNLTNNTSYVYQINWYPYSWKINNATFSRGFNVLSVPMIGTTNTNTLNIGPTLSINGYGTSGTNNGVNNWGSTYESNFAYGSLLLPSYATNHANNIIQNMVVISYAAINAPMDSTGNWFYGPFQATIVVSNQRSFVLQNSAINTSSNAVAIFYSTATVYNCGMNALAYCIYANASFIQEGNNCYNAGSSYTGTALYATVNSKVTFTSNIGFTVNNTVGTGNYAVFSANGNGPGYGSNYCFSVNYMVMSTNGATVFSPYNGYNNVSPYPGNSPGNNGAQNIFTYSG